MLGWARLGCGVLGQEPSSFSTSLAPQWSLGFAIFLLPWAPLWLRSLLKPLHVFFGAAILSLSVAAVISGINEKLFFSL